MVVGFGFQLWFSALDFNLLRLLALAWVVGFVVVARSLSGQIVDCCFRFVVVVIAVAVAVALLLLLLLLLLWVIVVIVVGCLACVVSWY